MQRTASTLILVPVLAALLAGCHSKPALTYEPQLAISSLAPDLAMPDNAFGVLIAEETQNRFPCTLVVARLAPPNCAPDEPLAIANMTPADEAFWAEAFRGFSAVRDLVFLSQRSLKNDGNGTEGLLAAARRLQSPLLLLHVVNRYGPNTAQVFGVVYDVEAGVPIATVGASSCYPREDGEEVALEDEKEDMRSFDARYQASRNFERYTLACLREQVSRDLPPAAGQPHRWTPLYPYCQPMPWTGAPPTSQPTQTLEQQSSATPPRPNSPVSVSASMSEPAR